MRYFLANNTRATIGSERSRILSPFPVGPSPHGFGAHELEFATGRVGFGEAWLGFFLVHANLNVPRSRDLVKYTSIPVPRGEYDPVLGCAIVI